MANWVKTGEHRQARERAMTDFASDGSEHSHGPRPPWFFSGAINDSDHAGCPAEGCPPNQETPDCGGTDETCKRTFYTPHMEDTLRRRLKYHFMTPCQKWTAKRRFPWKMIVQLLKIIMVTVQLVLFGVDRSAHVTFLEKSDIAFKHLFLQGWDPAYETVPYPAPLGKFAVYKHSDFYAKLNFAWKMYHEAWPDAIGVYDAPRVNSTVDEPMVLCKTYFEVGDVDPASGSYNFDLDPVSSCFQLQRTMTHFNTTTNKTEYTYDIEKYLASINESINFDTLMKVEAKFSLRSIHLKNFDLRKNEAECFQFDIDILFDNTGYNGQVPVKLLSTPNTFACRGKINNHGEVSHVVRNLIIFFDGLVILISTISGCLCIRSLYRSQKLRKITAVFFKKQRQVTLTWEDHLEFLNFWYLLIIVNDVITIIGSGCKIMVEAENIDYYEICGLTLGTGSLFAWFGILRYLSFFEKYNILILTMKKSFPEVIRYLICALMFFFGFVFCGWVVLGPYHVKFRSVSTASECLFALMNGDDIFETFAIIDPKLVNSNIWFFSRVYLYVFNSLFIYVVLNVFIALLTNAYECIKESYSEGGFQPHGDLMSFIAETDEDHTSPHYRAEDDRRACNLFDCLPCCKRHDVDEPNERTSLLNRNVET
ncbi:mucolipin-3 isoform X2 [Lingula anatina]|uniref:Mucolipin-3 isoform X2 n=1 Tax=Lingula anatina TaxID=7574 RepID=A0A1S3JPT0_LINAN|nr:mucolipin-3 isoform X2 [Lingula anatina]|eukprot:XP_013412141.1 mucolipin-3 isoform X2 [Lingula anatina]